MSLYIPARSRRTSAKMSITKSPRRTLATSRCAPVGSAAGRPDSLSSTPLIALPTELLLKILGDLENFDSLLSTILTCRRFFNVFQGAQQPLIYSTFARHTFLESDRIIYEGLMQLKRVIQQDIVSRRVARCVFESAWRVFRQKHLEELLIPFGRALAWSFVLDNHESDAVSLLRLIEEGVAPFGWSPKVLSHPPIQPIQELLEKLLSEQKQRNQHHGYPGLDFPLLEIQNRSKRNASQISLTDTERTTLLREGILFRDQSIVMRHSETRLPKAYPAFHHGIRRFRPIYNDNTSIKEVLAHRIPSVHTLLRWSDLSLAG